MADLVDAVGQVLDVQVLAADGSSCAVIGPLRSAARSGQARSEHAQTKRCCCALQGRVAVRRLDPGLVEHPRRL